MARQKLYAFVKDTVTGKIARVLIKPSSDTSKVERKIIRDVESGLYLYKHKYEYQDKKNEESKNNP